MIAALLTRYDDALGNIFLPLLLKPLFLQFGSVKLHVITYEVESC